MKPVSEMSDDEKEQYVAELMELLRDCPHAFCQDIYRRSMKRKRETGRFWG